MLVHGAVCDGRVWRRQLDDLSDEFAVDASNGLFASLRVLMGANAVLVS